MRQTATLSGGKVNWPTVAHAAQAVPQIAGGRKNWGHARLPKAHRRTSHMVVPAPMTHRMSPTKATAASFMTADRILSVRADVATLLLSDPRSRAPGLFSFFPMRTCEESPTFACFRCHCDRTHSS